MIWNLLCSNQASLTDSSSRFYNLSITTLKLPSVVIAAAFQAGSAKFITDPPVVVRKSKKRIGPESIIFHGYILVTLFSA